MVYFHVLSYIIVCVHHFLVHVFVFFFLMIRRPPRSTRTDTLFPYTTLFRSAAWRPSVYRGNFDNRAQSSVLSMIAAKRIHGPSGAACPISDGRKEISPMSETKSSENRPAVADALNALLADSFALHLKTKNYHLTVQGRSEESRVGNERVSTCNNR